MTAFASVVFGQAGVAAAPGAILLALADAVDDDGTGYAARAESVWITPDGAGGEAVFYAAFVSVTWTRGATLTLTPVVESRSADAVPFGSLAVLTPTITLPEQAGERRTEVFELPLMQAWTVGATERARLYLRGTRLKLRIDVAENVSEGDLIINGVEVEVEVQRETRATAGGL